SQRAIGTGVMGGMITATVLAVFLVPVFFVVVRRLFPHSGGAPHGTSIAAPKPVPQVPSHVPHTTGESA
ncbi:MAG TPA: efflux RND transporter permease subunit, partial [Aquabacterium sp.]|nr:efflux RND transporter permease subunit [Aquabacterium sp.]